MPQDTSTTQPIVSRFLHFRYAKVIIIGAALIVLVIAAFFVYNAFQKKTGESTTEQIDEQEQETPKEITAPRLTEDEQFFEFLDHNNDEIMTLNVPKGTILKDGKYEKTKWFIGEFEESEVRGHFNTTPLDATGNCEKYTEKFLSHLDDPNDGYVKYTHKNGPVACIWEGLDPDTGVYLEEMYIINDGVEYNLVVTNPVDENTGESTKIIRAKGVINIEDLELIFSDGFESGDMSVWTRY